MLKHTEQSAAKKSIRHIPICVLIARTGTRGFLINVTAQADDNSLTVRYHNQAFVGQISPKRETGFLRISTQLAPVFPCGQQTPSLSFCKWAFFDATSQAFQTILKSDSVADSLVSPGEVRALLLAKTHNALPCACSFPCLPACQVSGLYCC